MEVGEGSSPVRGSAASRRSTPNLSGGAAGGDDALVYWACVVVGVWRVLRESVGEGLMLA